MLDKQNKKVFQLCLGGIGGQGLALSSEIFAAALSLDGINAIQTTAHGIEARGGISNGEVIFGNCEINRLHVTHPDILLALHKIAFDEAIGTVKDGGIVIYDSYMIKDVYQDDKKRVYACPFTEIALKDFGSDLYTNVICMGYINAIAALVKPETLEEAVFSRLKKKQDENRKALKRGYAEAQKVKGHS